MSYFSAIQSVVHGLTAPALVGSAFEMQVYGPSSYLLTQTLWGWGSGISVLGGH